MKKILTLGSAAVGVLANFGAQAAVDTVTTAPAAGSGADFINTALHFISIIVISAMSLVHLFQHKKA